LIRETGAWWEHPFFWVIWGSCWIPYRVRLFWAPDRHFHGGHGRRNSYASWTTFSLPQECQEERHRQQGRAKSI